MRAIVYARYSSDLQRDASIEDQIRLCREYITRQGWVYLHACTDRAMSGASALRPGYQKVLEDARAGRFDVVVAEALDRLSRDQEDIAGLYKQLTFSGVKLVTLAEGEVNELHVGLKGTMNALFLKDLAMKIRRGQRGRVEHGRSAGGLAYGYRVVREMDARGEPVRGGRDIDEAQAHVVRRIFNEFSSGRSPRSIAKGLNKEGAAGPNGKPWQPSTIYGNWRRGTGILNNELYVGRLVWNRQKFVKDPTSGRRQARLNSPTDWIAEEVPNLRIVEPDLWQLVKDRQGQLRGKLTTDSPGLNPSLARRPRYLLSGLVKCGVCGSGYVVTNTTRMACAGARDRGVCSNHVSIARENLERNVLDGLKRHLLNPELFGEFVREFNAAVARLSAHQQHQHHTAKRELEEVIRGIRSIIEAIKAGLRTDSMGKELIALEQRKVVLETLLRSEPKPRLSLHPNLADVYRDKVEYLRESLDQEGTRAEAAQVLRELIREIRLLPADGHLEIEIRGELGAILAFAQGKRPEAHGLEALQIKMVAEEGFEPPTKGL